MAEVDRYLVTWAAGKYMEGFSLWSNAYLWYKTLIPETDPHAQILYWHAGDQEYKPASMPEEAPVTRLPLFAPIAQRHGRV